MMSMAVLRRLRYLLIGLAGLGLVLLILWAVVVVPPRLIDTSGIADPAKRLDEVNALRTTLAGVLGGLAVVAGAVVGALNLVLTQRVQWRAQVTERFTRAIDQLGQQGPEKLDVRIGAVYALEAIARDSAELHWPIVEVLTAYLREHAPIDPSAEVSPGDSRKRIPADHQAMATVIGRRKREQDLSGQRLDLHATDLSGIRWIGAHLERADLSGSYLKGADLREAHLEKANLREAHLTGTGTTLPWSLPEGADLRGAHLDGADLGGAYLEGADLLEAEGLTVGQLQAAVDPSLARLPPELARQLAGLEPAGGGGAGEGAPEADPGS